MSLRARIVLAIVAVLAAAGLSGAALAGWQAKRVLYEELAAALAGGRQTVESAFEDLPRSDHPGRDLAQLIATFDGSRHVAATLAEPSGAARLASRPAPAASAPTWFAGALTSAAPSVRIAAPVAGYGVVILRPVFANDIGAVWTEFTDLAAVFVAALAVGSALVWLTVGRALRPLDDFTGAFRRIGSGDYAAQVREAGPPELARLGAGVNEMARRLGDMQARTQALEAQLRSMQDEERADLARDLHDEIGPHLFAAKVDAALARRLVGEGRAAEALDPLVSIDASVAAMQRLVRDILGRLRPTELIELGLSAAISELIAFWRARLPDIVFDVHLPAHDDAVAEPLREVLYRVVQEGLGNAVRHGQPGRIEVEIGVAPDGGAIARVCDDGKGSGEPEGTGFGLIGMRERVAAVGGELSIARGPAGWSVVARLPAARDVAAA